MNACTPVTPQFPDCEPYTHTPDCCPPVKPPLGRAVCDVKFPVPGCEYTADSCDPCDCIPCFNTDELAMTAEAKAAVTAMLKALLQTLSPVERCGCDIIPTTGHLLPLKPAQMRDPASGQFLWTQVKPDGTTELTTSIINTYDNATHNQPAFGDLCCNGQSRHSAFLNSGVSLVAFKGGNAPGFFGGFEGSVNSHEFHTRVGELFCCAIDKLQEAPIMVIE